MASKKYGFILKLIHKITRKDCPNNNTFVYYHHLVELLSGTVDYVDATVYKTEDRYGGTLVSFSFDFWTKDLVIESAVLRAAKIVSGKNATLTAKVSGDAASIVVLDADGNAVEFKKVASNEKNGIVTFQAVWTVTGNRGDVLNFTVVVYDSNGLRSSNTVPVTVTIK